MRTKGKPVRRFTVAFDEGAFFGEYGLWDEGTQTAYGNWREVPNSVWREYLNELERIGVIPTPEDARIVLELAKRGVSS